MGECLAVSNRKHACMWLVVVDGSRQSQIICDKRGGDGGEIYEERETGVPLNTKRDKM